MPPRLTPSLLPFFRPVRLTPHISPLAHSPHRPASQFPSGGRRRPGYNRFDRARQIHTLWQTSPLFRRGVLILGAGGGVFYVSNIEKVPISERRRFNCLSESWEKSQSEGAFRQVMRQFGNQILPPNHPDSRMVERVMRRLIPASGLGSEGWEVRVIGDPTQQNAFVLPGGKVFVFSGILPICGTEDGLAAVLGHEIAHNVAHHSAEKMSQYFLLIGAIYLAAPVFNVDPNFLSFLLDYAVERPGSRKMETEADQLGLLMMAKSCYDPQKAVTFWERMAKAEQYSPPQWTSTHPSSQTRIRAIQSWVPEAQQARERSGCGTTSGFVDGFRGAYQQDPFRTRREPAVEEQPVPTFGGDDDDDFF